MIGLIDLLVASGTSVETGKKQLKIHLACWNGRDHPIDVFYAGRFKEWQESQSKRNFQCPQVLSLIDQGNSHWLFVGVYEILDCTLHPHETDRFRYSTRLLDGQDDLIARVVVHHKRSRASYIWKRPEVALPITEILPKKKTIAEFPGYNAVTISNSKLKIITSQRIPSWHGALSNVNGIYLITDTSTGKQYVGKASGNEGIWQRWCDYAENGHGKNVHLKKLLKTNGTDHARHFQYSILEIADTHASEADILTRESYWMDALCTREFGLN
jgi:hypothetical protein